MDEAIHFIQKNISVSYHFENQLKRIERWQFPIPVIREILLNAIIHRDYQSQTDIIIKIFDHSIEFVNPGRLMGNLDVESLMTDYYNALHRNKLLCEAFYLLGEVEKYGTGFIRIRKQLMEYPELKFEIENTKSLIKVCLSEIETIYSNENDIIKDLEKDLEKGIEKGHISKNLKRIMDEMMQNKYITQSELATKISINEKNIRNNIDKLKKKGLIQRIGPDKGGYWEVLS